MLKTLSVIMILVFVISFSQNHYSILNLLIILEGMMLSSLVFYLGISFSLFMSSHMFLVLITLAACEASLGLSILVSFFRMSGSDKTFSFSYFFA